MKSASKRDMIMKAIRMSIDEDRKVLRQIMSRYGVTSPSNMRHKRTRGN